MLDKNEGSADRLVRAVVGGGLLTLSIARLGAASGRPLGVVTAILGGALLFTAATGSCCLYRPLGIDTSK